MDLFHGLTSVAISEDFRRGPERGFLPVMDFRDEDGAVDAARGLVASLGLPDASPAAGPLNIALTELAENVIFHSGRRYGAVAAQTWAKNEQVELAIVDCGAGIPASIKRNPAHRGLPDSAALRKAIDLLVSGLEDPSRGQGLWMVSQYVERNGGRLEIHSQRHVLVQTGAERAVREARSCWPGTIVRVQLFPQRSLDISDVLERHFPVDDDYGLVEL
jgi:hypothetical protein